DLILIIPALLYFGFSIVSRLNIGYRHLLPAVVLLLVFASQVVEERFRTKWPVWAGGALAAWLVIGTNLSAPDCLAYFNEAVGGSSNGYKVLVDSNLDWGQDLIGLRSYMDASRLDTIKFSYFGRAEPEAYGIKYDPLPGYPRFMWRGGAFPPFLLHPPPGTYAISATNLQGAVFDMHNLYAWFRDKKPTGVIGHSIFIYKVEGVPPMGSAVSDRTFASFGAARVSFHRRTIIDQNIVNTTIRSIFRPNQPASELFSASTLKPNLSASTPGGSATRTASAQSQKIANLLWVPRR